MQQPQPPLSSEECTISKWHTILNDFWVFERYRKLNLIFFLCHIFVRSELLCRRLICYVRWSPCHKGPASCASFAINFTCIPTPASIISRVGARRVHAPITIWAECSLCDPLTQIAAIETKIVTFTIRSFFKFIPWPIGVGVLERTRSRKRLREGRTSQPTSKTRHRAASPKNR
jgi:hypothetical protein